MDTIKLKILLNTAEELYGSDYLNSSHMVFSVSSDYYNRLMEVERNSESLFIRGERLYASIYKHNILIEPSGQTNQPVLLNKGFASIRYNMETMPKQDTDWIAIISVFIFLLSISIFYLTLTR